MTSAAVVEWLACGTDIAVAFGLTSKPLWTVERAVRSVDTLLVEAAQVTVRSDPEWHSQFFHLATQRGRKIAKVAMARRLAVRLYWMGARDGIFSAVRAFACAPY